MTLRVITWDEYAKHTNNLDCWLLIDGRVYDTTTFLAQHPGGDEILLKYSGFDASKPFNLQNHSPYAVSIRDSRVVGIMESNNMPEGHENKVKQIKAEYLEAKRVREEKRRKEINQQLEQIKAKQLKSSTSKAFSLEEIAKHNSTNDCWVVIKNKVYDVSSYHINHPGGSDKIMRLAGRDATIDFDLAEHSGSARSLRDGFFIGYVEGHQPKGGMSKEMIFVLVLFLLLLGYGAHLLRN